MENGSARLTPRDGYDLPVYGLNNGMFYALHVPAIACIITSFMCALTAMVVSFRRHHGRSFNSWTICDRFIVYLAICDGTFNLHHGADHIHVTFAKDHVYPKELCQFYGFITAVFATAQNILVGITAVSIFTLMYFHKKMKFGRRDWILLMITFGIPTVGGIAAWCLGFLGPNSVICLTDGVKGRSIFILFFTVPLLAILAMNSILYLLTWIKIRSEVRLIRTNMGQDPPNRKTARRAAESLSLFVAAFFIQWWAAGLYGAWGLFGEIPIVVLHMSTIFTNTGGVLNLGVYFLVSRKKRKRGKSSMRTTISKFPNRSLTDSENNITQTMDGNISSISTIS